MYFINITTYLLYTFDIRRKRDSLSYLHTLTHTHTHTHTHKKQNFYIN